MFEGIRAEAERRNTVLWNLVGKIDEQCDNTWLAWDALTSDVKELGSRAHDLWPEDQAASLPLYEEAAAGGHPYAMVWAGWCYTIGNAVRPDHDRAHEYFSQAMSAGSWMATTYRARLYDRQEKRDLALGLLGDGVKVGHLASYFWLAWLRWRYEPTRKTAQAIRPFLDHAIRDGHPGARWLLAKLMMRGQYGLRRIPEGMRNASKLSAECASIAQQET